MIMYTEKLETGINFASRTGFLDIITQVTYLFCASISLSKTWT